MLKIIVHKLPKWWMKVNTVLMITCIFIKYVSRLTFHQTAVSALFKSTSLTHSDMNDFSGAPERSIRVKFHIKVKIIYSECRKSFSPVNLEESNPGSDQMNQSLNDFTSITQVNKMTDVSSSSTDVR